MHLVYIVRRAPVDREPGLGCSPVLNRESDAAHHYPPSHKLTMSFLNFAIVKAAFQVHTVNLRYRVPIYPTFNRKGS